MFTLANATRISLNTKQTHAEKGGRWEKEKTKRAFRFGLSATFHVGTKYTCTQCFVYLVHWNKKVLLLFFSLRLLIRIVTKHTYIVHTHLHSKWCISLCLSQCVYLNYFPLTCHFFSLAHYLFLSFNHGMVNAPLQTTSQFSCRRFVIWLSCANHKNSNYWNKWHSNLTIYV